jgi:hypothetical protein
MPEIDVHQGLFGLRNLQQRIAVGGHLAHARADQHQQVRVAHPGRQLRVGGDADVAHVVRMGVVEVRLAAKRGADGQRVGLGKAAEVVAGRGVPSAAADDGQGPLGAVQHVLQAYQVAGPRVGLDRLVGIGRANLDLVAQHVLRQRQDHGARPAAGRGGEGTGQELGHALGLVDLGHPFGHLAEHAPVVDLLEGLALGHVAGDLADEQNHRRRVLEGDVHPGGRVGGAGSTGDHADPGTARQLAGRFCHHRRAALLTAGRDRDFRRIVKRIEHREIAFTRHAEDVIGAMHPQGLDQQLSAALELLSRHPRPSRPSGAPVFPLIASRLRLVTPRRRSRCHAGKAQAS